MYNMIISSDIVVIFLLGTSGGGNIQILYFSKSTNTTLQKYSITNKSVALWMEKAEILPYERLEPCKCKWLLSIANQSIIVDTVEYFNL